VVPFPELACEPAFEPPCAVRRRFPMNGHRVVPHMWRPRTMVTPSCDVGRSRLYGTLPHLCPLNRGTPLDAPPPQGERRVEPCVLEFRPSSCGFLLLVASA
jgi:hypothetical protein